MIIKLSITNQAVKDFHNTAMYAKKERIGKSEFTNITGVNSLVLVVSQRLLSRLDGLVLG